MYDIKTDNSFKRRIFCLLIFFIIDAPIQRPSFYVERIDLVSKLKNMETKWRCSRPFSGRKSPHKFSDAYSGIFGIFYYVNIPIQLP